MIERQTEEIKYFSTKVELKIDNVVYRPSICYKIPSLAKRSLEKYAAEGTVAFYTERVRFVNGAVAKSSSEQAGGSVPSVVRAFEEDKSSKRKSK